MAMAMAQLVDGPISVVPVSFFMWLTSRLFKISYSVTNEFSFTFFCQNKGHNYGWNPWKTLLCSRGVIPMMESGVNTAIRPTWHRKCCWVAALSTPAERLTFGPWASFFTRFWWVVIRSKILDRLVCLPKSFAAISSCRISSRRERGVSSAIYCAAIRASGWKRLTFCVITGSRLPCVKVRPINPRANRIHHQRHLERRQQVPAPDKASLIPPIKLSHSARGVQLIRGRTNLGCRTIYERHTHPLVFIFHFSISPPLGCYMVHFDDGLLTTCLFTCTVLFLCFFFEGGTEKKNIWLYKKKTRIVHHRHNWLSVFFFSSSLLYSHLSLLCWFSMFQERLHIIEQ